MKNTIICISILIFGAIAGWYAKAAFTPTVLPSSIFTFNDRLADPQAPYLSASGTWSGEKLVHPVNTVRLSCTAIEKTCEMNEAYLSSLGGNTSIFLQYSLFNLTRVTSEQVVATEEPASACTRRTLLFDRKAKSVTLVITKVTKDLFCGSADEPPITANLTRGLK
jgi:hypothetical protein